MDAAQIQHALDRIELHAGELKQEILRLAGTDSMIDDLSDRIRELETELSDSEEKVNELELGISDLKYIIKAALKGLEGDAELDDVIEILSV